MIAFIIWNINGIGEEMNASILVLVCIGANAVLMITSVPTGCRAFRHGLFLRMKSAPMSAIAHDMSSWEWPDYQAANAADCGSCGWKSIV